jgi:hypothetical protein
VLLEDELRPVVLSVVPSVAYYTNVGSARSADVVEEQTAAEMAVSVALVATWTGRTTPRRNLAVVPRVRSRWGRRLPVSLAAGPSTLVMVVWLALFLWPAVSLQLLSLSLSARSPISSC